MKEITKQRIFFVVMITMFSFSMVSEAFGTASLTITPTSGPVGTTITASGTGFTPTTFNNTKINNNIGLISGVWNGSIIAEKFTGLQAGGQITKIGLDPPSVSNGSTLVQSDHSLSGTFNAGTLYAEQISLSPGVLIKSLGLYVVTPAGNQIRVKIYADSSGVPGSLLGESNGLVIGGSGIQNFTVSATVPSSGIVWGAFEINNSTTSLGYQNFGLSGRSLFTSHTYGSGPNPFGTPHLLGAAAYMLVNWSTGGSVGNVRVKIYADSSGVPGSLLGESGSLAIGGSGIQNFTVSATIPSSGIVWGAFETDNSAQFFTYNNVGTGTTEQFISHVYGPGPNPFGSGSSHVAMPYMLIKYSSGNQIVSFTWDNNPLTVTPSSVITNSTGGFSGVTFNAPISLVGSHTVKGTDIKNIQGSNTFTITIPTVSTSITGTTQFGTSNIIPTASYSAPPSTLTVTQEQLYKNGSLIQTITSPSVSVFGGIPTIINNVGELMTSSASYQVITSLTDGANAITSTSNSIIIQNPNSPGPSNGKQCSIDSCPSQTLVNYTVHRTPDFKTLIMTVNLQPLPFHTECNIVNGTFGNAHKWFNYTSVTFVNFTTHVPYSQNVYFACFGSGPILSGVSPGNGTLIVQGANTFNQTLGVTLGVPIGTFFIAMLGSLANQRTGPIYVVVLLAAVGIMAAVLFFTIPSGAWALELITGFLGIFVGRKIF